MQLQCPCSLQAGGNWTQNTEGVPGCCFWTIRGTPLNAMITLRRSRLVRLALHACVLLQSFPLAAEFPHTLDELWADFPSLDKMTSLESEVLKEWELDGVVCRIVRYQVGVFKGAPSRVAGFYAFPKGGSKLPALLELHGGGQSASLDSVVMSARRGYASLSLNWGGNMMSLGKEIWSGPQTDWGKLDATHPPQRTKADHFAGPFTPDDYTLDEVESPRNSNWFVVLMAARRAISWLEQQPEVDASRIGVHGHSMGGKLTTQLAGIEPRIKAAVPSCGGAGNLTEGDDVPGGTRPKYTPMQLVSMSDNAYIPRITCPILWLSKGSPYWQSVVVKLDEFVALDPKVTAPLANWQTVSELSVSPSGSMIKDGQKVSLSGLPWKGPREIRNLRWEGGEYTQRNNGLAPVNSNDLQLNFNDAIQRSLEQEKSDRRGR